MLTAAEFRQQETEQHLNRVTNQSTKNRDMHKAAMPLYEEADWMDFAERYADYVCDFEKQQDSYAAKGGGR